MASPFVLLLSLLFLTPLKIHGDTAPDTSSNMTHLHFYMHDTVSGSNPTAIQVAKAPSNGSSSSGFGSILVIDDPLTEGPNLTTNAVGRAQGFYAISGLSGTELLFSINLLFTGGDYNGSTVSIFGRDSILDPVRELSVIGGSGKFRMARGYVLIKTVSADAGGNAILDVDLYVLDSSSSIAENVPSNNGTTSNGGDAASSSSDGGGSSKSGVTSSGDECLLGSKFLAILVLLFSLVGY